MLDKSLFMGLGLGYLAAQAGGRRNPEAKILYHGTSAKQYQRIKDDEYNVRRLYLADAHYKAADYAEQQSVADGSEESVILIIDRSELGNLEIDPGSNPEEWKHDMGQWIYTGNIRDSIVGEDQW